MNREYSIIHCDHTNKKMIYDWPGIENLRRCPLPENVLVNGLDGKKHSFRNKNVSID